LSLPFDEYAELTCHQRILGGAHRFLNGKNSVAVPEISPVRYYNVDMKDYLPYVWDYHIDAAQFRQILDGKLTIGPLDQRWAAVRLLEYAPYEEIIRQLGFRRLIEGWQDWRPYVKSEGRRRGFDFLAEWIPRHHPELI
jgi:hypothetical protein